MPVKVLIVDDSTTMRALFSTALEKSKQIQVVGSANGAAEAREMIASLNPDVITLDVEMPGKTGLEFLEELMEERPTKVVMLSTLTQKGADTTLRAIELGAVDCFPKPAKATLDEFDRISGKLCKVVLDAAKCDLSARQPAGKRAEVAVAAPGDYSWDGSIVAVMGGVGAIEPASELLSALPANCPPTIVALAIDDGLAVPFASRVAQRTGAKVKLATDGIALEPGHIYVAADPSSHVVVDRWPRGTLRTVARDPVNGQRPSADVLVASLAKAAGAQATAILLSGTGNDGVGGLAMAAAAGAQCLVQTPESALAREVIDAAIARVPTCRQASAAELATLALVVKEAAA